MYAFISYMSIWDTYIGRCIGMLGMLHRQETHELHFPKQWGRLQRPNLPEDYPAERASCHIIGWWENFNRKTLYLMVKTMVSCKFSLKPIQWVLLLQLQGKIGGSSHPATKVPDLEGTDRGLGGTRSRSKAVRDKVGLCKKCWDHHKNHQISIWLILDLSSLSHEHQHFVVLATQMIKSHWRWGELICFGKAHHSFVGV